uniref:Uncharacterized protein n=1 Tax=Cynoglossus semilaevis TaxID=244447 RepID=A0A3P8VHP2_CYNSE
MSFRVKTTTHKTLLLAGIIMSSPIALHGNTIVLCSYFSMNCRVKPYTPFSSTPRASAMALARRSAPSSECSTPATTETNTIIQYNLVKRNRVCIKDVIISMVSVESGLRKCGHDNAPS